MLMNIIEYLGARRIHVGSKTATLVGLFLELLAALASASWPPLLQQILTWVGVVLIFLGMFGFLVAYEADIKSFREDLKKYIVPEHFAKLRIASTPFASALRELVDFYSNRHEGGSLPIQEDLTTEIEVEVLPYQKESYKRCDLPERPENYSWIWFKFKIKNKWSFKPVALRDETILKPEDFIGDVVVMSGITFEELYTRLGPRKSVYYPVHPNLYKDQALRTILGQVHYLRGGEKGLEYNVEKYEGNNMLASSKAKLVLEPLLQKATSRQKQKIVKNAFSEYFKDEPSRVRDICEGIYEIYRASPKQRDTKSVYIDFAHDSDARWEFESRFDYVLPTKVIKAGVVKPMLDQKQYEYPLHRVSIVKQLKFSKITPSSLEFKPEQPAYLKCFPNLVNPQKVRVDLNENGNAWEVKPPLSGGFWFPGDIVTFCWSDNLIDELLHPSEKTTTTNVAE